MVGATGLPTAINHLIYVGEVLAPMPILIGLFAPPAATVVASGIVVALLLTPISQFFTLSKSGG